MPRRLQRCREAMTYLHLVSPNTQIYRLPEPLELELGGVLPEVQVAYRTWGALTRQGDNAILVCHALTGHADVDDWWAPLLGPGHTLDPTQDFIVCSNILGSCYGTTGPTSLNPETGQPYGPIFPAITVRDMVRVQAKLLEGLGVQSLRLAIGGSLGGMQVLEWGALYGDRVQSLAVIAAPGRYSPWCIGLSEAQRQAIYTDPRWQGGHYAPDDPPVQGLAVARMIAMSTYRSWASFHHRFGRNPPQLPTVPLVEQTQGLPLRTTTPLPTPSPTTCTATAKSWSIALMPIPMSPSPTPWIAMKSVAIAPAPILTDATSWRCKAFPIPPWWWRLIPIFSTPHRAARTSRMDASSPAQLALFAPRARCIFD